MPGLWEHDIGLRLLLNFEIRGLKTTHRDPSDQCFWNSPLSWPEWGCRILRVLMLVWSLGLLETNGPSRFGALAPKRSEVDVTVECEEPRLPFWRLAVFYKGEPTGCTYMNT